MCRKSYVTYNDVIITYIIISNANIYFIILFAFILMHFSQTRRVFLLLTLKYIKELFARSRRFHLLNGYCLTIDVYYLYVFIFH